MYIDSPYRRRLIESRVAEVVSAAIVADFDKYLHTLQWLPTSLDWGSMPPSGSFRLTPDNEGAAVEWVRGMAIGKNSHVVAVYKWDEPGLMCTIDAAIFNLGGLFAGAGGKRFFFGANRDGGDWSYIFSDLMEFDGGEVLTAVR